MSVRKSRGYELNCGHACLVGAIQATCSRAKTLCPVSFLIPMYLCWAMHLCWDSLLLLPDSFMLLLEACTAL